jgi:hypothetical protein
VSDFEKHSFQVIKKIDIIYFIYHFMFYKPIKFTFSFVKISKKITRKSSSHSGVVFFVFHVILKKYKLSRKSSAKSFSFFSKQTNAKKEMQTKSTQPNIIAL